MSDTGGVRVVPSLLVKLARAFFIQGKVLEPLVYALFENVWRV